MDLEKEIEALILESREIKFIDNKQKTGIGTFGRVSPRLLQWYKNCEKIIYDNAGVFSKAWKDFENFDVDKVNGNHAGEFNRIKTGIIDILRSLVIKNDTIINIQRKLISL
jgi:hypothetical protein